ncbi:hypothetical protein N8T08_008849 [Aspergillus melleus]|uniref:Uncharacterized protein n=1 Tax=Aspergillus melleus TaxID=138277 RepID=A0ACC3AV35_9EURO|nr:hypothetical protein N8T08_008849 [Aspergillus melleus]
MPTTRSKSKRAEEELSSSPKPSIRDSVHWEQNAFWAMINAEKNWPCYNMDKAEDRETFFNKISIGIKEHVDSMHEKIQGLSDEQKSRIISELEGVCLQEDWDTLRSEVSACTLRHFGEVLAEAMIYKVIFTTFYENPFWHLDGKMGPEDNDVDPYFARAMEHLYGQFFLEDPEAATLWRMQLFRLMRHGAGNKSLGVSDDCLLRYNRERVAPFRALATELLERESFQWLLKDEKDLVSREIRLKSLARAIDVAASKICTMEGAYGGHTLFYTLAELGATYSQTTPDYAGHMRPHRFNREPEDSYDDLEGHRLVLIVRPAVTTMLSPFRKWLVQNNETIEVACSGIVVTGRFVPVTERDIKKEKEEGDSTGEGGALVYDNLSTFY